MQKMTLLEMTQNILSSMNSDEVSSIGDTVESQQVAEEIRTTFYQLFTNLDVPELEGLIHLGSPANPSTPHLLTLPDDVASVSWIKYKDYRTNAFHYVDFLDPEEFMTRIVLHDSYSHTAPYVDVPLLPTSPINFHIRGNEAPHYYTVLDDPKTLVFNSVDLEVESHLTASNSVAWGRKNVVFNLDDDFVPQIDANLFPLLLAEAKSACFINVKEVANSKEEQRARRQLVRSQTRMHRADAQRKGIFSANDYSRHGRGRTRYRYRHYRGIDS